MDFEKFLAGKDADYEYDKRDTGEEASEPGQVMRNMLALVGYGKRSVDRPKLASRISS